jgi:hypothetical protein
MTPAPVLTPDCWADLLADRLAEADAGRVAALTEAEAYRAVALQALTHLAAETQAHAALRAELARLEGTSGRLLVRDLLTLLVNVIGRLDHERHVRAIIRPAERQVRAIIRSAERRVEVA